MNNAPQVIEIPEIVLPADDPDRERVQKGHKLTLSREKGYTGYHLFATINTNGKQLGNVKQVIICWTAWVERIFNFIYNSTDENIFIDGDQIKIDIGPFNRCKGAINFLKRTEASTIVKVDILDYIPEYNDFGYEENYETQSMFCPHDVKKDLVLFIKQKKKLFFG